MSDTEESVCEFHYSSGEDDAFEEPVPPPAKRGRLDEEGHAVAGSSAAAERPANRLLAFDEVGSRKGVNLTKDGYSWTVLAESQLGAMMTHTVDGACRGGGCLGLGASAVSGRPALPADSPDHPVASLHLQASPAFSPCRLTKPPCCCRPPRSAGRRRSWSRRCWMATATMCVPSTTRRHCCTLVRAGA